MAALSEAWDFGCSLAAGIAGSNLDVTTQETAVWVFTV